MADITTVRYTPTATLDTICDAPRTCFGRSAPEAEFIKVAVFCLEVDFDGTGLTESYKPPFVLGNQGYFEHETHGGYSSAQQGPIEGNSAAGTRMNPFWVYLLREGEVTTVEGPQHRTTTQWPARRYPIPLQLRYEATSEHGTLHGFGQAKMMSSKDIIFAPGDGLKPGMKAEIAVAWPLLLDGHTLLQLVLEATITGSQDGVAEARILRYHFRTRRPE